MYMQIRCSLCEKLCHPRLEDMGFCVSEENENIGTGKCYLVCVNCEEHINCNLRPKEVNELKRVGARFVKVESHPGSSLNGPDFTRDDLLEFHELLCDEERVQQGLKDAQDLFELYEEGSRFEGWFMRVCAEVSGVEH